jgi:methionyl-tRNA synthetase
MDNINYQHFQAMDLRVGQILAVEDVPGADRLYKLRVSLGGEEETSLVAGIKLFYPDAQSLVGKKVAVVVNLEPKVIRGVESRGMVLAASDAGQTQVVLLSPEKDIPVGSKIK